MLNSRHSQGMQDLLSRGESYWQQQWCQKGDAVEQYCTYVAVFAIPIKATPSTAQLAIALEGACNLGINCTVLQQ